MQSYHYILCAITVFCLILAGCDDDFLVKSPPDAMAEEDFFQTADHAISGVNAIYSTLGSSDLYEDWMVRILEVPSDDILLARSTGLEFNNFSYTAADQILFTVWGGLYEGIFRSNKVIEYVPEIEGMDPALQDRLVAEARFLRALFYHHLTEFWGDVPLITETFEETDDVLVPKSPRSDIYAFMVEDLEFAADILPSTQDQEGRATRYAAKALLGTVHLYHEDHVAAKDWLGRVIDSGQFELLDDFQQIIHHENPNHEENIFELQFDNPPPAGVGTWRVAWNIVQPVGAGHQMVRENFVESFEEDDPRLEYSVYRDGDDFCPECSEEFHTFDSGLSATGYAIKKGMYPAREQDNRDTNQPLLRYADVLLMYAEAVNEVDGPNEARPYINEVRERPSVDMPPLTAADAATQQEVFEAIVHERRVELAFEHKRFFDLRRWGLGEEYLGEFGYSEDRHRWFPLPQNEVDVNPELEQIEGW